MRFSTCSRIFRKVRQRTGLVCSKEQVDPCDFFGLPMSADPRVGEPDKHKTAAGVAKNLPISVPRGGRRVPKCGIIER